MANAQIRVLRSVLESIERSETRVLLIREIKEVGDSKMGSECGKCVYKGKYREEKGSVGRMRGGSGEERQISKRWRR